MTSGDKYPIRLVIEVASEEDAAYIGAVALEHAGRVVPSSTDTEVTGTEYAPAQLPLLNTRDFSALAQEQGFPPDQGTRAYNRLVELFQNQTREGEGSLRLPELRFASHPDPASHEYDRIRPEEVNGLDVASLRDVVAAIDGKIAVRSPSDVHRLYHRLGRNVGPKTLGLWRAMVQKYFPEYEQSRNQS